MNFYQSSLEVIFKAFGTNSITGLTVDQVRNAQQKYGLNERSQGLKASFFSLFINQFKDPLVLLLIASGFVIFFAGGRFDAFIIAGILLLNATIGAVQEGRIASIVSKLLQFKKSHSLVIRDGKKVMVNDDQLVPGDIVLLQEGELVPADGRIIESYDLTVDESVLTGESESVSKNGNPLLQDGLALHQQTNMVFSGSYVRSGNATIVIVATGDHTESGKVNELGKEFVHKMPLEKDLAHILQFILWVIVFICISLLGIGIFTGKPFAELLAALVALFICVVPQGLSVIMTLVLVSGAHRMAQKKVLAKQLQAVEAMGRAQVIVLDKTGTITRNELMVCSLLAGKQLYQVSGSGYLPEGVLSKDSLQFAHHNLPVELERMLHAALLLDRSQVTVDAQRATFSIKGNTSEVAMRICAEKAGLSSDKIAPEYEELFEIPFSAAYQYHAGFYKHKGKGIVFGLGSPEVITNRLATHDPEQQKRMLEFLDQGFRVIAVGYKEFDLGLLPQNKQNYGRFFAGVFDHGLELLGCFAMQDTLRDGAAEIIKIVRDAGIKVVVATGDNSATALHIARQANVFDDNPVVLDGPHMQRLSDQDMQQHLESTALFARMLPVDKLRLIGLFQRQGKTVLMVGDGVNDGPALAAADLGIALGGTGSETAKDSADVILLDDSFESIVLGLEQGRHIFYTFKRVILYFFITNFSEVLVMLFALAAGYPVPLVAAQILWLNLMTDGFIDSALSLEEPEPNLLRASWFKEYPSLITPGLVIRIVCTALITALFSFGVFVWYMGKGLMMARTMCLVTITYCQWISAINSRSLEHSSLARSVRSNPLLIIVLIGLALGQIAMLYVPFLQRIFKTVPLGFAEWKVVLILGTSLLVLEELRKALHIRWNHAD